MSADGRSGCAENAQDSSDPSFFFPFTTRTHGGLPAISATMNATGAAVLAASAWRSPRMQGRRRFLTLGGHRRSFAFISLAYLPCSGPPLENIICALRPSRVAVLKDRIPIFAMFCLHVGQLYVEAGLAGPAGSLPALAKSGPRNARRLAPATCPSRVDLHFRPADLLPSLQISESASHAEWWQEVERLRSASTETTCGALARTFPGATAVGKYDNGTRRTNEEIVGKLRPG